MTAKTSLAWQLGSIDKDGIATYFTGYMCELKTNNSLPPKAPRYNPILASSPQRQPLRRCTCPNMYPEKTLKYVPLIDGNGMTPALCMRNLQAKHSHERFIPFTSTPASPDLSLASLVSAPSQPLQSHLLASLLSPSHALPSSPHVSPPGFCAHSLSEGLWTRIRASHLPDP